MSSLALGATRALKRRMCTHHRPQPAAPLCISIDGRVLFALPSEKGLGAPEERQYKKVATLHNKMLSRKHHSRCRNRERTGRKPRRAVSCSHFFSPPLLQKAYFLLASSRFPLLFRLIFLSPLGSRQNRVLHSVLLFPVVSFAPRMHFWSSSILAISRDIVLRPRFLFLPRLLPAEPAGSRTLTVMAYNGYCALLANCLSETELCLYSMPA